jgi:hypothetical protein
MPWRYQCRVSIWTVLLCFYLQLPNGMFWRWHCVNYHNTGCHYHFCYYYYDDAADDEF